MRVFRYPFQVDIHGHIATTDSYADMIKAQLIDVLMTNYNERVMRPNYGSNMQGALFDPTEEMVRSDAARQVMERIQQWAPRVVMKSVQFSVDHSRPGQLFADVIYQAGPFDQAQTLHLPVSSFLSEETQV